jgi:putative glycosyltransferase (TIGR04372 family)
MSGFPIKGKNFSLGMIASAGLLGPLVGFRDFTKTVLSANSLRLMRAWNRSGDLWADGHYKRAVHMRRDLLDEANALWPRRSDTILLSHEWVSNMGHLGWLAAYFDYQAKIPMDTAPVVTLGAPCNTRVYEAVASGQRVVDLGQLAPLLEVPPLWPISERLSSIRTPDGYKDMYKVWEETYGGHTLDEEARVNPAYRLMDQSASRDFTEQFANKWGPYVIWLNRRSAPGDPRSSPETSWHPAIRLVQRIGYTVVRVGHLPESGHLPAEVVDMTLTGGPNRRGFLDLDLLRGAAFVMTSNSGPGTLAATLGVPVMQANTIAIGRNALSARAPFVALPKHPTLNGRRLTGSEIFDSNYAYSERPNGTGGFVLEPNSATEIEAAVSDLALCLKNQSHRHDTSHPSLANAELDVLRRGCGVVSMGYLAPSFLDKFPAWLR